MVKYLQTIQRLRNSILKRFSMTSLFQDVKKALSRINGFWAIDPSTMDQIRAEVNRFHESPKLFLGEMEEIEPQELLTIVDDIAYIEVAGPLVDKNTCASLFYGCTSYEDISLAVDEASNLINVTKIVLRINSPGGMVDGVDALGIKIRESEKMTEAHVSVLCTSAAYWIASQCNQIIATSPTASFGSIGVVVDYWINDRARTERGEDRVQVTSTNAPNKRLDPLSPEGTAQIRAQLDEIEDIFVRRIAEGRGIPYAEVTANFGRGGVFLAEKSLAIRMIDKNDFSIKDINSLTSRQERMEEPVGDKTTETTQETSPTAEVAPQTPAPAQPTQPAASEVDAKPDHSFATKVMLSKDYPDPIKELAAEVVNGTESLGSLKASVAAFDATKLAKDSKAAADDTEDIGETPTSETPKDTSEAIASGRIVDAESHNAAVKADRELFGF